MEDFLFQSTIYLGAAVIAVPVAKRLGLGSVLGYLIAGVVIGPLIGLVGSETQNLQHFAEFGVVMMLFVIGLELEPRALWDMRHRLIGLGGLQVSLTTALIAAIAVILGQPISVGIAIGMVLALSSTAIVLQTLTEKGLMHTAGGRSSFSVLLTQDIAVIPMLALIPLMALQGYNNDVNEVSTAQHSMSLVRGLPGWGVALVTLAAVAAIIFGGHYLTRPLFRFIASARLREMFTAATLLLVIGIALLMTLVGLSPALGTFLAGVVLANSEFRHELESDIEPFKGLLLGLFFITVGAGIDFDILFGDFIRILSLTLAVMLIKALVLLTLARIFKLKGRDQWLFTLGLAQAGEFGFVLLAFSVQTNVLPLELSKSLLLVVALSMLLTPALFILYDWVSKRAKETVPAHPGQPADEIDETAPIIIAGVGRFGQTINRMISMNGLKTTVLDHNIDTILAQRKFGMKGFYGDPTRPELMQAAGLMKAEILVVAVDDQDAAVKLTKHARRVRPDIHIIARAYDRAHVYRLYQAGASQIVRETFDSSIRAGKYALMKSGIPAYDVETAASDFYDLDRQLLKEMSSLWDPNVPITENKAFMERARELNSQFITALDKRDIAASEEPPEAAAERPAIEHST
ncbi:MAG: monovalent cation:proton antiporter-2 (CPA2) family protein [Rhodobacteraceae bacterium]|nr:monovalent cation:proton antiporter-2 (CPA2) family protein [Paracoccaceae bacterium]